MIMLAKMEDLEEILATTDEIKKELLSANNLQWGSTEENYPNRTQFENDIKNKSLYIYKEDNIIKGFISVSIDTGYYDELLENSKETSYILHRLAIKQEYRNQDIARKLLDFCEKLAIKNNIKVLKGDTEEKNLKMNSLFLKLNYKKIGEFEYDDYPGHYIYYEKEVGC